MFLTREGVAGSSDVGKLKDLYSIQHVFHMPGLVGPDLLRILHDTLGNSLWVPRVHGADGGLGSELTPVNGAGTVLLNFSLNAPACLEFMRKVTGAPIRSFSGRIYRLDPHIEGFHAWHNDAIPGRLVGLSINLGERPYTGGIFVLREKDTGAILRQAPNAVAGDAIVFRISKDLQHRVTPVEGTEPKTAFAGWFLSGEGPLRKVHMRHFADPCASPGLS